MSIENDQEKLMNATAQVFNNSLSAGLSLASLYKPKVKIEVKTAQNDLHSTRQALKAGWKLERIKETLFHSPVAERIKAKGNDVSNYINSIVRKAKIDNEMEKNPEQSLDRQQDREISPER